MTVLGASRESGPARIVDDPALSRIVAEVRARFLATRAEVQPELTRLDITVLLPRRDGAWRRGSHNPTTTAYPASCVKLAYLASAMAWCRERGLPPETVDADARPMMAVSDNVATGLVVDRITATPNVLEPGPGDPTFDEWIERRGFTERYLKTLGLLGNQTILHKTYPTNSGEMPIGYEKRARDLRGPNAMQPALAAELVLRMVTGEIEPQANRYIRELMAHDRWKGGTVFGFGLPPGTVVLNKVGLAYDTLEDIAYIRLPNGREMVMAAFSNAFSGPEPDQPFPYNGSTLGVLAEMMVERLGLARGCPPRSVVDDTDARFRCDGEWTPTGKVAEALGGTVRRTQAASGARAEWTLRVPRAGLYEVCVWYPQREDQCGAAEFTVLHADGESVVKMDQRHRGGRWVRLGDFRLDRRGGRVALAGSGPGLLAADAVKAAAWPADR